LQDLVNVLFAARTAKPNQPAAPQFPTSAGPDIRLDTPAILIDDISVKSDRAMLELPHSNTGQKRPEIAIFGPAGATCQL
jgi:hypothetical protein